MMLTTDYILDSSWCWLASWLHLDADYN